MCQNADYKFADLKTCCSDALSQTEKKIKSESGKDVVLIAYEKR